MEGSRLNGFSIDSAPGSTDSAVSVLLVEADAADARLIEIALGQAGSGAFRMQRTTMLSEALESLAVADVEVVLIAPDLPDCTGMEAFDRIRLAAPDALIIALSGEDGSEAKAQEMILRGADEFVSKRQIDAYWLPRALRYVRQRKYVEAALRGAEEALFEEKERAQVTLNSIGDAVLATDVLGNVTYLNEAAESLTGWMLQAAAGQPLGKVFNIIDGSSRQPAVNPARRAMDEDRTVGLAANCVLVRRDGTESGIEDSAAPIHDRHGQVSGAVIVFRDVSQSRAMTSKMAYLAQHDFLTGLWNRARLTEQLGHAISLARRHTKQVGLLFLDVDHFKRINDLHGHETGDHVLCAVADSLVNCVRSTDTVCRQGGDEFIILLAEIETPEDAARVAEKVLAALAEPLLVDGQTLQVAVSIGISVYPVDGEEADTIIQHADAAMYQAKKNGRNNYRFFRTAMSDQVVRRRSVATNLHRALDDGEFLLHYQPQVDLGSGRMVGMEALVRWLEPSKGLIYPGAFIQIAEHSNAIVPMGHWVRLEACRQINIWRGAHRVLLPVSVNVSTMEFRHNRFIESVAEILEETGLEPSSIELELTESVLMEDADMAVTRLRTLKDMGIRIAIDDFGTGYSSLSYLRRFPVDTLKIDKSFVLEIGADPQAATIVSAVIGLGRKLGHRVVAEGVETEEQKTFLQEHGCRLGQGFHLSHPLPAADIGPLLVSEHAAVSRVAPG